MNGIITSIQRMSIHDGPGLRTVIFMKGCNMRCKWCHNPETWSTRKQVQYVQEKCIRCGSCVNVCPSGALQMIDGVLHINHDRCLACGTCQAVCCTEAISLVGEIVTPESLFQKVKKDMPYWKESEGGVTLSGGEPLMQKDFARAFLTLCKENGISTAVETNMSMPWKTIETFIPMIDHWMCDLKIYDDAKHQHWTGIHNTSIIEHILRFGEMQIPLRVRLTIIPGVNDSEEEVEQICKLLAPYAASIRCDLLPFHIFGFSKFETLGMTNELIDKKGMPLNRMAPLKEILTRYNLLP